MASQMPSWQLHCKWLVKNADHGHIFGSNLHEAYCCIITATVLQEEVGDSLMGGVPPGCRIESMRQMLPGCTWRISTAKVQRNDSARQLVELWLYQSHLKIGGMCSIC